MVVEMSAVPFDWAARGSSTDDMDDMDDMDALRSPSERGTRASISSISSVDDPIEQTAASIGPLPERTRA
jgi:hypothetical protein